MSSDAGGAAAVFTGGGAAFTSTTGFTADADAGAAGFAVTRGAATGAGAVAAVRAAVVRGAARLAVDLGADVRAVLADRVGAGTTVSVVSVTGVAVEESVIGAVSVEGAGSVVVGGVLVSVVTG